MMMEKAETVRAWCAQRVGCPYIYGGTGQPCTPAYREARMRQYPQYAEKIRRNCKILSGKSNACYNCRWCDPETDIGKPAYDCAQLARWAMDAVGIGLVSGANSQWEKTLWSECGTIDHLPEARVALVFRWDDDHMGHVGVYQGDGTVIHAKGHDDGVVRQALSETRFTHYGIPYGLYEEVVPVEHPTLRRGDSGYAVTYLQTLLSCVGTPISADGKFGSATEAAVRAFQAAAGLTVDGVVGPKTWAALEAAAGHDEPPAQEAPEPGAPETVTITRKTWDAIWDMLKKSEG